MRSPLTSYAVTSDPATEGESDWAGSTYPIAAIFGGNATGKSSVLDALRYAYSAIRLSATTWQASKFVHRVPFRLDGTAKTSSSTYEIDFVHDDRRHVYGFEVDAEGIKREWMRDVPRSRWRTLLERDRDEDKVEFHPSLGKFEVTPRGTRP
ncbi:AAA family ATPase [Propioniciclava flava]